MRRCLLIVLLAACSHTHAVVIRGGLIVDGRGGAPYLGDVAIDGDKITAVGVVGGRGRLELDARGLAVAPGFINMLSHAEVSLLIDGGSQSDLRQGVTLEVFGETSMGPIDARIRDEVWRLQGLRYPWRSLGDYLARLERFGIACNVASFVGTGTVRRLVVGDHDRRATADELAEMRAQVAAAMDEGALGVTSALVYAPGAFADTDELIALAEVAAARGGSYAVHLRDEGLHLVEAIDEVLEIARRAGIAVEIYHFKQAGQASWSSLDAAVARIEEARADGLRITADVYPYTAAATGLDAAMPRWVQAGGPEAWAERLADPEVRARVAAEMRDPDPGWDNFFAAAGPEHMVLVDFASEALRPLIGQTLAEVAAARGTTPEDTAMDLVVEDGSRVGVVYELMSEDNLRRELALPWVSFGSDAPSMVAAGRFVEHLVHPRAYGTFARVLGLYVRDEGVLSLAEAVRRMTSLPAETLGLADRGALAVGRHADIVLFDPATIDDRATFAAPHAYATGVVHVLVNGIPVLRDGEPTDARPGRVVRGAGYAPGG